MSSGILGRTDGAPSSQRTAQPKSSPPKRTMTTAKGVSELTASPARRSPAPERRYHLVHRERRARSLATSSATRAVSMTKMTGLLRWRTATATAPCSPCQMLVAMIAAIAAAAALQSAFTALRMSFRTRAMDPTMTTAIHPRAATTSAPEDNHRGIWRNQRDTSFESSVLPVGSVLIETRSTTMKISEKTASNKSLDRRTRSRCGEWASPGGGLMPTQGSPWARTRSSS